MKNILKYVGVFITIILIFVILLIGTSLFPSEYIKGNVKSSAEILVQEGNRKIVYVPQKLSSMQFDNYSDALMINTAYSIDNSTPLYSSFVARKNYIPDTNETIYEDSVGELHSASKYKGYHNEVGELQDTVNGEALESFEYARYWHGYLVLLRPLLLIFNLIHIRIIITVILITLAVVVLYNMYKKLGLFYAIIFLLGLVGVEYFYIGLSIQGCFIFLITMIFMKIILEKDGKLNDIPMYFLIVGMITNFLDLLTNPLITLGMPLILIFLLNQREKDLTIKEMIILFLKTCIPWVLGYGLTWTTKWILIDVIYNKGLIKTAISQVLFRTKGTGNIGLVQTFLYNYSFIEIPIIVDLFIIMGMILWRIKKKINCFTWKEIIVKILPYICICAMPYIWYFALQDHSYKHSFFTYRNQILMLITIPICYFKSLNINGVKNEEEK